MKRFLFLLVCIFPLCAFSQFNVGHRTITYNDPARSNRAIECEIYYPGVSAGDNVDVIAGEFPIIVFGHGFAMQTGAYPNFWNEYVPKGYIMVFPTTEGGTIFPPPDHGEFGADLKFLVNEMQTQGQSSGSPFFQSIASRSAIMGHSMGGGATFIAASGFNNVDCVIGLAPAETDPSAIAAAANVSAPVLIFSGSSDGVTPPNENHIPIYNASASSCKYFVSIENGSHCYFASNTFTCTLGEIIPGSLPAEDQRQVTYAVLTPWLDYFLKDDCDAWDDFETALASETDLGTINSDCENDAPVIVDNNGTLESNQQSNYQWYLNGSPLPNEDQQTHTYSQSGSYQVGSTIIGNCPTLSNEITVQITGIEEIRLEVKFGNETVEIQSLGNLQNVRLEWLDASGRILQESSFSNLAANGRIIVERPQYQGLKLLRLRSNKISKVWKVI